MPIFKIKRNHHKSSGFNFGLILFSKRRCMEVTFLDSCIYTLNKNEGQINKIFGVSNSWLPFFKGGSIYPPHHKNSIRFGWRCIGDEIEVLSYVYINKERTTNVMFKCKPGDKINLSLELDKSDYLLKIEGQNERTGFSRIPSKKRFKFFLGYALFPYFGGKEPATHDMEISLNKIKKII